MKTTWKGTYLGNSIEVQNTWFKGEKLFINGNLQDFDKNGFGKSALNGIIKTSEEKMFVRVKLIAQAFSVACYVFVDDQQVDMKKMST